MMRLSARTWTLAGFCRDHVDSIRYERARFRFDFDSTWRRLKTDSISIRSRSDSISIRCAAPPGPRTLGRKGFHGRPREPVGSVASVSVGIDRFGRFGCCGVPASSRPLRLLRLIRFRRGRLAGASCWPRGSNPPVSSSASLPTDSRRSGSAWRFPLKKKG